MALVTLHFLQARQLQVLHRMEGARKFRHQIKLLTNRGTAAIFLLCKMNKKALVTNATNALNVLDFPVIDVQSAFHFWSEKTAFAVSAGYSRMNIADRIITLFGQRMVRQSVESKITFNLLLGQPE